MKGKLRYKKNQVDLLDMDETNSRLDMLEEKVSELHDTATETIQTEAQKRDSHIHTMWASVANRIKPSNFTCVTGVPEKTGGREKQYLREWYKFSTFDKSHPQIQEAPWTHQDKHKENLQISWRKTDFVYMKDKVSLLAW